MSSILLLPHGFIASSHPIFVNVLFLYVSSWLILAHLRAQYVFYAIFLSFINNLLSSIANLFLTMPGMESPEIAHFGIFQRFWKKYYFFRASCKLISICISHSCVETASHVGRVLSNKSSECLENWNWAVQSTCIRGTWQ